jgi:hypothetical protein
VLGRGRNNGLKDNSPATACFAEADAAQHTSQSSLRKPPAGSQGPRGGPRHLLPELPPAVVIGLMQGVSELSPVPSLGHTVTVPSWIDGSWARLVRQESQAESPYLALVVGLHLATARSTRRMTRCPAHSLSPK